MICTICKVEFYRESELDPAEPCRCGQMAEYTPYDWDGWRGVRSYIRWWAIRNIVDRFWIIYSLLKYGWKER